MSGLTLVLEEFDDVEFVFGSEPDPGAETMLVIGPRGLTGDAATPLIGKLAGADLGGHRAVKIALDGQAYHASPGDADIEGVAGITTGAASSGTPAEIQTAGEMVEFGWSWTPGGVIFCGDDGVLTQILPEAGAIFHMGRATGPNSILIDPRMIARL